MGKSVVLVVEDDPLQRKLIRSNLEGEDYEVVEASSRGEALDAISRHPVEVAVVDYKLGSETGIEVIDAILAENALVTPVMVTAYGNIERAVEALRHGAYDYVVKPIDFEKFLLTLGRAVERQKLKREVALLKDRLGETFSFKNFVIASPLMEDVARLIAKASQSDATVLISGETGTGKDLVAKTIHFSSKRKDGPFLGLNIPSLPETLVESELFGAEKGAFTGAHERKTGKFEAADGGTLFLDEIGDLPAEIQVKLLRFLQEREFYRLGSSRPSKSDVRVIAATNQDIEALRKEGRFRADLYYRLNVIHIHTPPLRQRKTDIAPLVDLFVQRYARREGKGITALSHEAMNALMGYPFPGNIRELENIIERAIVFAEGDTIRLDDLPVFLKDKTEQALDGEGASLTDKVRRLEIREIRQALRENDGVKSRAARALGITERMLAYKIKSYGLPSK
jgi:DNA-binding NtrC family response regulator